MTISKHELIHAKDACNGYHGWCKHCNVSLETDLGYCTWDNLKCIDREITCLSDMPADIESYTSYCGYIWDKDNKVFVKPYSNITLSLDEIQIIINNIKQ